MLLVIPGNTLSQKNGKQILINRATGKPFVASNENVRAWKKSAVSELQHQFRGYKISRYPISVTLIFFFDNKRRHDLDNAAAGVMDALVQAGVLEDDSVAYVETLMLQHGGISKDEPRCEIYLDD